MCGLTGFARNPNAPALKVAKRVFTDLMLATGHRGRHASGLAVVGCDGTRVFKRAVSVDTFVRSSAYINEVAAMTERDAVMLGHVRYATHNNAQLDEAAHPFAIGKIVGAHNGIVYNWRDVEKDLRKDDDERWINDSQAPFSALAHDKDAEKALDRLDGYWALTWTKGKRLFFARTNEAPLSAAYAKGIRTMFWNSERKVLEKALADNGIDADIWDVKPNTIYSYDMQRFDGNETHAEKRAVHFRGRKTKVVTDARTNGGYYSQTRIWPTVRSATTAPAVAPVSASFTLRELDAKMEELMGYVQELANKVDVLESENEHLYEVLNEAGIFETSPESRQEEYDEAQLDLIGNALSAVESPYAEQDAALRAYADKMKSRTCVACKSADDMKQGNPLCVTSRGTMHLNCLKS